MLLCVTPNPAVDHTLSVPTLMLDGVNRAPFSRLAAGGKGVNVARAARTLGETVMCAGFLGGPSGDLLETLATAELLPGRWTRIADATRLCTIVLDPAQGHNTVINEHGPTVTDGDWDRLDFDVWSASRGAAAVCLSGSVPPGTPEGRYARLVARLRDSGQPVWVDISGPALASVAALNGVHLKVNQEEAGLLLGRPLVGQEATLEAAVALSRGKSRLVVLTSGAEGAVLASGEKAWHSRSAPIERKNAVGSGDSTLAGLCVALLRGEELSTALAWGVAAGSANAANLGGASFTREEFDAMLAGVSVHAI